MKNLRGRWALFLLALVVVASVTYARERGSASVRTLLLSDHPGQSAPSIYVMGRVATVLRFEQPCDPARTRLLGWEGRFEPLLVGGRKVVLEPLRDLDSNERVPLLVTLADGTEVPFLLAPPPSREGGGPDQRVNVFKDRSSYDSVLSAFQDTLQEKQALEMENERLRKEETSVDHAFAALLLKGAAKQTPFKLKQSWSSKDVESEVSIVTYSGQGKVAVLFTIKNQDPRRSWRFAEVRLTTMSSRRNRVAAVRAENPSIVPGATGSIAVVADRSAFVEQGRLENLVLELFRADGLRHAVVLLDPRMARE